jgi:uncharacterized protein (DUF4213/DUF364 family)
MTILDELIKTALDGDVINVCIGMHWTAVVVEGNNGRKCGLASTAFMGHSHTSEPDVPEAGYLEQRSGIELAKLSQSSNPVLASVGVATINALLPIPTQGLEEANAENVLIRRGDGKRVVMIGRFPFAERLRSTVGELVILEKDPGPEDLPAQAAYEVIPDADVVAITSMTVINHTLDELINLCKPKTFVMLLGPSTPLSPLLFDHGIDVLSGAIVEAVDPVLRVVMQGGNFRQVHHAGVRLVNISSTSIED